MTNGIGIGQEIQCKRYRIRDMLEQYKGFKAVVRESEDLEGNPILYGEVTNCRDFITFSISNESEAQEKFKVAVDDYIDLCTKIHKEPDMV